MYVLVLDECMPALIARIAPRCSASSSGRSYVHPIPDRMFCANVWVSTATHTCGLASTKFDSASGSGSLNTNGPRYVSLDGVPLEPVPPQLAAQLRFGSTPNDPSPLSRRVLRHRRLVV